MNNNFITTVNEDGQIAIPEIVRRRLNIQPGDKVELRVKDEFLTVKRLLSLEETFGSVTPINKPERFEELLNIAKNERTQQSLKK